MGDGCNRTEQGDLTFSLMWWIKIGLFVWGCGLGSLEETYRQAWVLGCLSKGNSGEAGAMVALWCWACSRSVREWLGDVWKRMPGAAVGGEGLLGASLGPDLSRGPPGALSLQCEAESLPAGPCPEVSQAPTQQGGCGLPAWPFAVGTHSLLEYDTETKEVKVLLDQLRFANGVQLSPDEDFVLVAETTMARIRRCVWHLLSGLCSPESLVPGVGVEVSVERIRESTGHLLLCVMMSNITLRVCFLPPCLTYFSVTIWESLNLMLMHIPCAFPIGGSWRTTFSLNRI